MTAYGRRLFIANFVGAVLLAAFVVYDISTATPQTVTGTVIERFYKPADVGKLANVNALEVTQALEEYIVILKIGSDSQAFRVTANRWAACEKGAIVTVIESRGGVTGFIYDYTLE